MEEAVQTSKETSLLNKNFIILIFGSFISAIGGATANLVLTIATFDETGNIFFSAIVAIIGLLPTIFASTLFGPFIDTHSRKWILIGLDFLAFISLMILAVLLNIHGYLYYMILVFVFIQGLNNALYQNSYDTIFPATIPKGSFQRAYSIAGLVFPLSLTLSAPIAVLFSENLEYWQIMLFTSIPFLIVAILELFIDVEEVVNVRNKEDNFVDDISQAYKYVKQDKGLRSIFMYFFFTTMAWNAIFVLLVPYFKMNDMMDVYVITVTAMSVGRVLGSSIQVFINIPTKARFIVALCVYIIVDGLAMLTFIVPGNVLIIIRFFTGVLAVTSFNIRMSSVQNYIDPTKRGRVNSLFTLFITIGGAIGTLTAGYLAQYQMEIKYVPVIFGSISLSMVVLIMFRNRKHVKKIYNVKV